MKAQPIKAQQILKTLVSSTTSATFQNKKLKRSATYAIADIAEVVLCASNCALPTSVIVKQRLLYLWNKHNLTLEKDFPLLWRLPNFVNIF